MPKSYQNIGKIESNRLVVSVEDSLACPRMVTRIWGIIVAIAYISSGGSLLVNATEKKCKITGIYMLVLGIILVLTECPCCLLILRPDNRLFAIFEKYFPFWLKGLIYIVLMLTPIILCFHWKTMLVALTMIILAILYFFLTCLQGSKRYERLRGQINHELKRKREEASVTYNSLSYANATVSAFQSAARQSQIQKAKTKTHSGSKKPTQKTRT